jgi:hypothetical protein
MITMGGKKKNGGKGSDVVAIILERSCAQQLAIALALALGGVSPLGPKKGKGGKGGKGGKTVKGPKGVTTGGGGKKGGKK